MKGFADTNLPYEQVPEEILFEHLIFILPYYSDKLSLQVLESNIRVMMGDLLTKTSPDEIRQNDIKSNEIIVCQEFTLNDIRELWLSGVCMVSIYRRSCFNLTVMFFKYFPAH
jgi:hypothetical protein